ncbi:MAG: YciI family protein [Caulobacteraceae bacterium]
MHFILLNFPGDKAEGRTFPDRDAITGIMNYTAELRKAGVLLALGGFKQSSLGARVRFDGDKPSITDGPFSEAKELIGGYWLIQVNSKAEAVEWASRGPAAECEMIEVRQLYAPSDFPAEFRQPA